MGNHLDIVWVCYQLDSIHVNVLKGNNTWAKFIVSHGKYAISLTIGALSIFACLFAAWICFNVIGFY